QHQLGGDVPGGVDAGHRGAADPVDDHGAALVGLNADLLQAQALGLRDLADGEQHVAALHGLAVVEVDEAAVPDPLDLGRLGVLHRLQAPALEHVLDDQGGVLVVGRQDAAAADHEGHLGAEAEEGGGVLGSGGPGPDHHQVLGDLAELVDVLAGEDDLAVGGGGGHPARFGPGGEQDGIALDPLGGAARPYHLDGVGVGDPALAQHHPDPVLQDPLADVLGLGHGQVAHPAHDRGQVDLVAGDLPALHALEVDAQAGRDLQGVEGLGRGQQGLARDTVPQDTGPAQPLVADDRDIGPEVGRDQGGLVAARPPSDDDDPHGPMVATRAVNSPL